MIGYCCNCLDGQLNCQVSAHWLMGMLPCIDYAISDWAIAQYLTICMSLLTCHTLFNVHVNTGLQAFPVIQSMDNHVGSSRTTVT